MNHFEQAVRDLEPQVEVLARELKALSERLSKARMELEMERRRFSRYPLVRAEMAAIDFMVFNGCWIDKTSEHGMGTITLYNGSNEVIGVWNVFDVRDTE